MLGDECDSKQLNKWEELQSIEIEYSNRKQEFANLVAKEVIPVNCPWELVLVC